MTKQLYFSVFQLKTKMNWNVLNWNATFKASGKPNNLMVAHQNQWQLKPFLSWADICVGLLHKEWSKLLNTRSDNSVT